MSTLYSNVVQSIIRDIKATRFPVGSMLPSEPELARRYGVSRSTVRAALERLQAAGLVNRRRGAGTMVKAVQGSQRYTHSMVVANDIMQFAGDSWRDIASIEDIVTDETLAPSLDNRPGKPWIRMGQRRWVEGKELPVCWTDLYIDTAFRRVCDAIPTYPGLVYTLIEEEFDVCIQEIKQTIESTGVPESVAANLDAKPHSHALRLTRRYIDTSNRPIVISISILPADRYVSEIKLVRTP